MSPPTPSPSAAAKAEAVPTEQPPSSETQLPSTEEQISSSFKKITITKVNYHPPTDTSGVVDPTRKSKILADVETSLAKLASSDFYLRFLSLFDSYDLTDNLPKSLPDNHFQFVAYGVGSIEDSSVSRLQLSLAILLLRKLPTPLRPQIYDPVFNATECAALEDLGFSVLPYNEQGARVAQETPMLFYLPLCEIHLVNNLLVANWHPEHLLKMTILGDTLISLPEELQFALFEQAPYILAAGNFCTAKEVKLDEEKDDEEIKRAFLLQTWHFFEKQDLKWWEEWCERPDADPKCPTHLPFRKVKTPGSHIPPESNASTT